MGGPIVRTGTTPEFWKNWDRVFGEKTKAKKETSKSKATLKGSKKNSTKTAKKKAKKKK